MAHLNESFLNSCFNDSVSPEDILPSWGYTLYGVAMCLILTIGFINNLLVILMFFKAPKVSFNFYHNF